jgi:1,2-diacylglycerol-3-alpha-glucose alpha-1,2-glucosyltransferase
MTTVNYILDNRLVNRLTSDRKWLDSYIPSIAGRVKKEGIDVVFDKDSDYDMMHIHIPMVRAYRMSFNNNNRNNTPIIFHGHMTEDTFVVGGKTKYFVRKWLKSLANKADIILCPSHSAAEYYRQLLPEKDIRQLNYGIDLGKYAYSDRDRQAFRQEYGIGENEMVVCSVGGLTLRKGVSEFCEVASHFPDMRFMWVGGSFHKKQSVKSLYGIISKEKNMVMEDLPSNVMFIGYVNNVPGALSGSDIFFFPSRHETQGLALVEAAANGRPIVTRDLPVFREWLTHDHDCLMGSIEEEFNTCLRQLADDPSMMKRLGSAARRSAEKYHDIDKTSKRLVQIYNELLEMR